MKEYVEHLKQRNYTGLRLKWEILENFTHSYEAAVALMAKGLQYIHLKEDMYRPMLQMIMQHDINYAIEQFKYLKKNAADEFNFTESALNNAGYFLLRSERANEAIRILQLNTEEYPRSANAFDSLADAYLAAGDKNNALACVKKSLALIPEDPHASDADKEQMRRWANEKLQRIRGEWVHLFLFFKSSFWECAMKIQNTFSREQTSLGQQ